MYSVQLLSIYSPKFHYNKVTLRLTKGNLIYFPLHVTQLTEPNLLFADGQEGGNGSQLRLGSVRGQTMQVCAQIPEYHKITSHTIGKRVQLTLSQQSLWNQ